VGRRGARGINTGDGIVSTYSTFEHEEADIVRLESGGETLERQGWINCGAHSVRVYTDEAGNLLIEAYPCANEAAEPLASLRVSHTDAMMAGACDLDGIDP
jgi:hypothetical protein